MEVYMVGGVVRDYFLGRPNKDVDYLIVGATTEEVVAKMPFLKGECVGNDFPVFICEETGDEYAMARRERKTGAGYGGFSVEFDPSVTVEEDLFRRDLTINAMAMIGLDVENETWERFVDPYNGLCDLIDKVLRPVSEAFMEDPVRVLRLARFRARMGSEWTVHESVGPMVRKMVKSGELSSLTPERIYKEMSRALLEPFPRLFFDTLLELDALNAVLPEIFRMKMTREPMLFHPEGDTYEHTMLVLTRAAKDRTGDDSVDTCLMFNALLHDIGKTVTPIHLQPAHSGHDKAGVPLVYDFGKKYTLPRKVIKMASMVARFHMLGHDMATKMSTKGLRDNLDRMSIDMERAFYMDMIFRHDEAGRLGKEDAVWPDSDFFMESVKAYLSVKFADVFPAGEKEPERIVEGMKKARGAAMKAAIRELKERQNDHLS